MTQVTWSLSSRLWARGSPMQRSIARPWGMEGAPCIAMSCLPMQRGRVRQLHCMAARHVSLMKIREKLPPRERRRAKYQDEPNIIQILPSAPEFPGRMLVEVNSANGPIQLRALVKEYGPDLDVQHVASAMSRLAGWATAGGLTEQQMAALDDCARRCIELLRRVVGEGEPLELARAAYCMYRLRRHDTALLSDVVARSSARLGSFSPEALAGLVAALGGAGHVPPQQWLERVCLEAYARLPKYGAQELANLTYGLAKLGHTPSETWLQGVMARFRETASVSGANAPSFVKMAWALAALQVRPSFNWATAFYGEVRQRIDLLTPRELATLAWAIARLRQPPDLLLRDAWFRAATRTASRFPPAALVAALAAAAAARLGEPDPPPAKFVTAALARTQATLGEMDAEQHATLLWALAVLRVAPDEGWMDAFMDASETTISGASPAALADAAWALARLRYQPSDSWAHSASSAVAAQLPTFSAGQLGVLLWAWRAVQLEPPAAWEPAFRALSRDVYGSDGQRQDLGPLLDRLQRQHAQQEARAAPQDRPHAQPPVPLPASASRDAPVTAQVARERIAAAAGTGTGRQRAAGPAGAPAAAGRKKRGATGQSKAVQPQEAPNDIAHLSSAAQGPGLSPAVGELTMGSEPAV